MPTDTATTRRDDPPTAGPLLRLENTWGRELEGLSVPWRPQAVPVPRLLFFNDRLAAELGLDASALQGAAGAALFAGNAVPECAEPLAQAYAGHQFGGFSPQLGDGRAVLLGEWVDPAGVRHDIALKGSGRTPFSRGGDGKAAVGPMLREAIIGEAMHALGIPTTRALAVAGTGEDVYRETALPGAVLTRVAASHIRVGTFQFLAARGDPQGLRRLADYTIARHDPDLAGTAGRFLALLERVVERQALLIAQWMNVGFIHGVMNTDNMAVSGETIDYGPCAFVEAYDPKAVFSSIDTQGRYAFGNQPPIALWNLARFAETLLPLVDPDDDDRAIAAVTRVLEAFPARHAAHRLAGQRAKLGLMERAPGEAHDEADTALAAGWLELLRTQRVDHTLAWWRLADAVDGPAFALRALFADVAPLDAWLARWAARRAEDTGDAANPANTAARMRAANPWIIPRNHRVEEALAAATVRDDLGPALDLIAAVREPYAAGPAAAGDAARARYAEAAPAELTAGYRTYCGT